MKRERLLESELSELATRAGFGEFLECLVGALGVRRVVFVVIQFHDPCRDVRLEGAVVVA